MKNKYILNYYNLQIANIVLQSTNKPHSKVIKSYIKSNYSHSIICVYNIPLLHTERESFFSLNLQEILGRYINIKRKLITVKTKKYRIFLREQKNKLANSCHFRNFKIY